MKPSTKRSKAFRERMDIAGLKEVRGVYAEPELHRKIKNAAQLLRAKEKTK